MLLSKGPIEGKEDMLRLLFKNGTLVGDGAGDCSLISGAWKRWHG